MNHEIICSWLGLPADAWPPDHYQLLGLQPGESDIALIESRVHQRLDLIRRYQSVHPEQATEAMNRLAQAFVCLTEPPSKLAYDAQLLRRSPTPPPVRKPPPEPLREEPVDPHVWLYTPGENGPSGVQAPPIRVPATVAEQESVVAAPPPPVVVTVDPDAAIREAAQQSRQARKHLATRRALYLRVLRTRYLQRLWHKLGHYFSDPLRKLTRPEASELYRLIEQIEEACEGFPLLGQAGHPGHLILSLTQYDRAKHLRDLDPLLRESLLRDWESGLRFLELHRDFLRTEIAAARLRSRSERFSRAMRAWLNEKPSVALLVLLGLLALCISVWYFFAL